MMSTLQQHKKKWICRDLYPTRNAIGEGMKDLVGSIYNNIV